MFNFLDSRNKIVTQSIILLTEQIDAAKIGNPLWNDKFSNAFVLGYVMGFSTILIKSKTKDDGFTAIGTKKVFESLFGAKNGIRIMQTASIYQDNPEFKDGLERARVDLIEFINNDGARPNGLMNFLKNDFKKH